MNRVAYSVVVPVFNEAEALAGLAAEISDVMDSLGGGYECIFVDDGSTDGTAALLRELVSRPGSAVRCIRFTCNRGQGTALYTGLCHARGELVITLDGDGQNCPADIPPLIDELERRQADLICGFRRERRDSALRKLMSRLANEVRSRVLKDSVRDSGCALRVMRRSVLPALLPLKTLYSFLPALVVAGGFRVGEYPVRHRARQGGASSYGLRAFMWRPFIDMLGVKWYQMRCVPWATVHVVDGEANVARPSAIQ